MIKKITKNTVYSLNEIWEIRDGAEKLLLDYYRKMVEEGNVDQQAVITIKRYLLYNDKATSFAEADKILDKIAK